MGNYFNINFRKRYNDGVSLVCSTFAIGVFKAGGLFEGLDIQITEFF